MVPEAVFSQFPMKTAAKFAALGQNLSEKARNPAEGSSERILLSALAGSSQIRTELDKSHDRTASQHTASMKPSEYYEADRFLVGFYDLGSIKVFHQQSKLCIKY
ncbi:unnamed protein product [Adineta ricciae]|uniref:Uncharacterized protein n=1 Tax=Adineta ricciae TaxID=249248 RepID=A0A816AZC8_ADIRI|nr:unnamed protein product [Adineta ricciae]